MRKEPSQHGQFLANEPTYERSFVRCSRRRPWNHGDVTQKRREELKGTGFVQLECTSCPCCSGKTAKIHDKDVLRCSSAGAHGVYVTVEQARECRGMKPAYLQECPPRTREYK